jgi:hypothetical protein
MAARIFGAIPAALSLAKFMGLPARAFRRLGQERLSCGAARRPQSRNVRCDVPIAGRFARIGSIFLARGETFAQKTIFSIGEPLPS